MKSEGQKRPPVPYALILLALVVCAGITLAVFFSFRSYADQYRLAVENDLRSIANLKVDELVQWRKERAGDAEVFFRNELFIAALQRYYEDPKDREQLDALRSWLFRVRGAYGYSGIGLFDRHRNPIVGYSETVPWTHLKTHVSDALKQNAARFIDFHRAGGDGTIVLSVLAPIYADREFSEELAVLVLQIDPCQFLYPLIQSWPVERETAETLLLRRDGEDVLFLSKVRFMEEAPLELRLPLAQTGLPSALAAGGREGVVEGEDYRGKEVVAVLRSVPDSPWFLVVKMDTAELYTPLRSILYGFVGLVGALLAAIIATVGGLWQRRAKNHYLQLYHSENLREQSEERFRVALSGASVIVATCDNDLRYTWIYNTHPDFQDEAVLGKRDTELSSLEGTQELMLLKRKIVESGGEVSSEIAFSTSSGEIIYDVKAKAMRNDNGEVIGVTTVAWDITARKALEIRYASLFNSVWDAILITDMERTIIDYNSAFAGLFEYSYNELMGRSSDCIYHDNEEREKVGYKLKEYTEESEPKILLRYRKKSGATFRGETLLSYLRDTKGNVLGIIKVIRDVTDRELMEQQLIEAQKLEALGQLAGGIAHDFNNVLMTISGASQVLEKRSDSEANQKLIAAIRASVKRGNAVTGRMLSFTRSSEPETKTVALASFLSEFKDFARHTLPQHVHVHIGEVSDEQGVYADPDQLQQVLITLSINAADAMPEGGNIYFEVRRPTSREIRVHNTIEGGVESYCCIEVIDEGTGMDEQTKSRAFDPFFTTKDSTKGTGLGLFVVYKILQLHKGWIDIDSSPGKGTVFILGLPAAEKISKIYEAQEGYESGQGETILIIDDETPILTMLDAVLTENGYQTLSAENGEGSLKLLEQEAEKVDLIITDIGLPDMNGKALILKFKELYPSIPIIAMTGYTDTAIGERLYKAGADIVVKKPYDMDELSRDIRSLL